MEQIFDAVKGSLATSPFVSWNILIGFKCHMNKLHDYSGNYQHKSFDKWKF